MRLSTFAVLSDAEVKAIHEHSLRVLHEVGVTVHSDAVLDLLEAGGASVQRDRRLARLPRRLVERCLKSVPAVFPVCDTEGKQRFSIGERPCRHCTGFDEMNVPLPGGAWRPLTKRDISEFSTVADALDNVDLVGPQGMPHDVMPQSSILHGVDAVLRHTTKPVFFAVDGREVLEAVVALTGVVVGASNLARRPSLIVQISPSSPLCWTAGAADSLLAAAGHGVPITCLPQPMAGASAPLTLAGELVIGNAEYLSCCVITQLARKGAPLIYGAAWTVINMHHSNALFATPEALLLRVAGLQMARQYGKPAHVQGLNADAPIYDEQLGWEKALTGMMGVCGGADLIVGGGAYGTAMVSSSEQLVVDNEILGIIRRLEQGITVSDDSIAFELIKAVGPQGSFLAEEHTVRHLRSGEHYRSSIVNKDMYSKWEQQGFPDVVRNAAERTREILSIHKPRQLSLATQQAMQKVIDAYEEKIRRTG